MMNNNRENSTTPVWYKSGLIKTIGVLILFIAISYAYFTPAVFEGRTLFQMDVAGASGNGSDVRALEAKTGHHSLWTGSLFGGMPMYQISPSYPSTSLLKKAHNAFQFRYPLPIMQGDTYLIFMMLLGFYIFMRSWGYRRMVSILGAIMWAFSSYFIILIDAGHIWKLLALSYIPPTIGGLVLAFKRRKYLLSFFVTGLFTALQIYANHIQMSYYFGFVMIALLIGWAVEAAKSKDWGHFTKSLLTVVIAGLVGLSINATNLYHTYTYSKYTMRGGSELKSDQAGKQDAISAKGLQKSYITQWSYGKAEMLTFLIPNARGGATETIGDKAAALDTTPQNQQFVAGQSSYWGDQPFTSGPVYVGAFVLFLAIFGIFACKGAIKWSLLGVTILTIALSWGHNFMWLSDLFIDYFPLYNKFRTVSSILVVSEMTIPIFAVWAVIVISRDPSVLIREKRGLITATIITAGLSALIALAPSVAGSYISAQEQAAYAQYMSYPAFVEMIGQLVQFREGITAIDAWISLLVIAVGCLILFLFYKRKIGSSTMIGLVALLALVDLWHVDKRYLNDSKYLPAKEVKQRATYQTSIDQKIDQDTTQYRVMNLTVNTFNDATTSLHHRSVGGYHAAKLQRYQDVIEGYLSKMDSNVLRALNTKYYIVADSLHRPSLITDPEVYGDAWFVSGVKQTTSPTAEYTALASTPLDSIAVIAPPFNTDVENKGYTKDSTAVIKLTSYQPDDLTYHTHNDHDGLVVFSEIYYPKGWHITIDGKPAKLLRADYILRALQVPAGDHTIRMYFAPRSFIVTERISYIGSLILFLALLLIGSRFGISYRERLHQR